MKRFFSRPPMLQIALDWVGSREVSPRWIYCEDSAKERKRMIGANFPVFPKYMCLSIDNCGTTAE